MPLEFVRNDITKMECDAVVNAANESLLGGGGVDGAIHRAAGPALLEECRTLGGCKTGSAKITNGYNLKCKYIIHTVGPVWRGGGYNEEKLLKSCYSSSLSLAKEYGCETVAFPIISSGVYGYPMRDAVRVAVDTIADFLMENDMLVYLVFFGNNALSEGSKLVSGIKQYIDDNYVELHTDSDYERMRRSQCSMPLESCPSVNEKVYAPSALPQQDDELLSSDMAIGGSLSGYLKSVRDESFSEMLLRKIDESGMTDSECYRKANIDRKLFSKIRSNPSYRPSKPTVLAFCIALQLPISETREMLLKAGFALSHSSVFDIIVEYFIINGIYDIYKLNETLFEFDQSLLGSVG